MLFILILLKIIKSFFGYIALFNFQSTHHSFRISDDRVLNLAPFFFFANQNSFYFEFFSTSPSLTVSSV